VAAAEQLEADHDAALEQWRLEVDRARYQAGLAERRYLAVDPDNRLVARGLERDWEAKLAAVAAVEAELASRQQRRPKALTPAERAAISALGSDVGLVWQAPTTTDRDRKELLRACWRRSLSPSTATPRMPSWCCAGAVARLAT
jgi:hypothetical protein